MADVSAVSVMLRGAQESDQQPELLVLGAFEGEAPEADGLGEEARAVVQRLAKRPGWKGREDQVMQGETGSGSDHSGGTMVSLFGLGKRAEFNSVSLSQWISRVSEHARLGGVRRLVLAPPRHPETSGPAAAERVLRFASLSGYRFERYHGETSGWALEKVAVAPPPGEEESFRGQVEAASAVARGAAFARDMANTPGNEAHPGWMEERARELAKRHGMAIEVLDAAELERRGMGGLFAVGLGSAHPPRLVRLAWGDSGPTVALVGKGITFDTGGISIKPAQNMEEMKYDKCGACAVLGILQAAAELRLPVRLRGYIPLAENMPGSRAYRPGDILRFYNKKTAEITNTDAEGRLILADALALAAEEKPDTLIEFSTLTGAIVVALGHLAAGLFTPDDGLAAELLAAADDSGERLWRMPLYPEYLNDMKGIHADLLNSAGRAGASSTAAAFLSQFVGDTRRWAHLDIAGVANLPHHHNGNKGGATGFGVAATIAWLRRLTG